MRDLFRLRHDVPWWRAALYGAACVIACYGLWWFATRGEVENRILGPTVLPSPHETFETFPTLWVDRELTRNVGATLRRVVLGFGLAVVIGVPLGVLAGCFFSFKAFMAPLAVFGRNIPVAALIALTYSLFGIDEFQKVMFIFIACVAFVFSDSARAIMDVAARYIDTAYTLGANRRQVILQVLVPLALPTIFDSLRLLFGLAFGYIMLAETITTAGGYPGVGGIINISLRRNAREHVLLILLLIPVVAITLDRILFWIQCELFPYRYGGAGVLHSGVRALLHGWEDFKQLFRRRRPRSVTEFQG